CRSRADVPGPFTVSSLRRRLRVIVVAPSCLALRASVCHGAVDSKRRRCGIAFQDRPERLPQRSEPIVVLPPLLERVPEDGLAHLLGAGRAHGALILVEPQARLLEGQPAVLEE